LNIQHHISLKPYNTFGLDVKSLMFSEVNSLKELKDTLTQNQLDNFMFLGGGSNVLFTKDFDGLVIKNNIKGKEIIEETDEYVKLKIYSGENWHELVMYCVERNWGGIENLSLIPGTVGAAPMQNIGAYGVELEKVFIELEAFNLNTFKIETFNKVQCEFGYRESIFKRKLKNQYFIFSITLLLQKQPIISAEYGDIQTILAEKGIQKENASIKNISDAVITIRQSKLPDPKVLGNSGSFFKNPQISVEHFEKLKLTYPHIKGFEQENGIKVPAAWLIEQSGWKGKRIGNTGSHEKQALVLVNYGGATGNEVWDLAQDIIKSVKTQFDIALEAEVNVI
jgi:UDP-N-acetylmuramate dehydrogenase